MSSSASIHPTAIVDESSILHNGVKVWHFVHVRELAELCEGVSVGKGSYIDRGVKIGRGSRIQNDVNVYSGVSIGEFCFIGPAVVFTNDLLPRVGNKSWNIVGTTIGDGASIGAGAIVRCGVTIGPFAMVGAGALVTKDVPPFTLSLGHPAGEYRRICACGQTVTDFTDAAYRAIADCCESNMSSETLQIAKRYAVSKR